MAKANFTARADKIICSPQGFESSWAYFSPPEKSSWTRSGHWRCLGIVD
jgi:hypothetical protein